MALSKSLEEAIKNKDLNRIYSTFYTIILSDPGFRNGKFDSVFNEVKASGIENFIQKYNGTPFKNKGEWNQNYWDGLISELMDNFCVERIEHIKAVSRELFPYEESNVQEESSKLSGGTLILSPEKNNRIPDRSNITLKTQNKSNEKDKKTAKKKKSPVSFKEKIINFLRS